MVDKAAWDKYWVNMAVHPNLQVNEVLSESHRKAAVCTFLFFSSQLFLNTIRFFKPQPKKPYENCYFSLNFDFLAKKNLSR